MLSISITEFQLEAGIYLSSSRRSRPASDRGIVAQALPTMALDLNANAPRSAVKGGTLAGHPITKIISTALGYQPNKILVRCSECNGLVSRYTGYKHDENGKHQVLCEPCHAKRGLPLRERETYAELRD